MEIIKPEAAAHGGEECYTNFLDCRLTNFWRLFSERADWRTGSAPSLATTIETFHLSSTWDWRRECCESASWQDKAGAPSLAA